MENDETSREHDQLNGGNTLQTHRVSASIPFLELFRELPDDKNEENKSKDLITTFQINAGRKDGNVVVAENDAVCKKYVIDGKKEVVFKITLALADDRKKSK